MKRYMFGGLVIKAVTLYNIIVMLRDEKHTFKYLANDVTLEFEHLRCGVSERLSTHVELTKSRKF